MANKKIGFYFESSLPVIPSNDDFAFYYIKNEQQINGENKNIPDVYLYNKSLNQYFQINKPHNLDLRTINSFPILDNNINLGLNDILNFDNETDIPLNLDGNLLYSKLNSLFFTNRNIPTDGNVNNSIIFGTNFGNQDIIVKSDSDIYLGNNINISNPSMSNIVIGNDIEIQNQTIAFNNNMFIGGTYDFVTESNYTGKNALPTISKIENNIFIKNLGFGNTQHFFKFVAPLVLSDDTYVTDNIDKNVDSLLFEQNSTKKITKYPFTNFNIDTILRFGNNTSNSININGSELYYDVNINSYKFGTIKLSNSYINLSNNLIANNPNNTINLGNNNFVNNILPSNLILIGNQNSIDEDNFADNLIIGNKNFENSNGFCAWNLIFGSNNGTSTNLTQNNLIFGNGNNIESSTSNNLIFGNGNNYRNNGENNIIFGNNTESEKTITNYGNNIIFGNYAEKYLNEYSIQKNNLLILNNYSTIDFNGSFETEKPLLYGSFDINNKHITINGKLIINPFFLPNKDIDITFNKILSVNNLGEVGTLSKSELLKDLPKIQRKKLTNDFKTTSQSKVIVPQLSVNVVSGKLYKIKILGKYGNFTTNQTTVNFGFVLTNNATGLLNGIFFNSFGIPQTNINNVGSTEIVGSTYTNNTDIPLNTILSFQTELIFECTQNGIFNLTIGNSNNLTEISLLKNTLLEIEEI